MKQVTLGEVCLETADVRRLADFYKALLGVENGSDDPVHQFILTEGASLTVYNSGIPKNCPNRHISLAFTVEDVDQEYERLRKMNAVILEPPKTHPWGARNLHFCDPDGNHLYFRSFPKKSV